MTCGLLYRNTFIEGIRQLKEEGLFTDVTIQVENRKFRCHKLVLGALSPYFKAMFSIDMRESKQNILTLPDLSAETFEDLLHFIYHGDIKSTDNVEDLFRASCFMQIGCLQTRCEELLLQSINSDNCLDIWKLGNQYDSVILSDKSRHFILSTFQNGSNKNKCLDLSADELLLIIGTEKNGSAYEDDICDVAMEWLQHNKKARKDSMKKIILALRPAFASSQYVASLAKCYPFLENDETGRKLLADVQSCHSELEETLVVVGGSLDNQETQSQRLVCFSFRNQTWFNLSPPPHDLGLEFASCAYGQRMMVVSGGKGCDRSAAMYDGKTNTWLTFPKMCRSRWRHAAVANGNCVYVLGGCYSDEKTPETTLNTIEECNMNACKWKCVGALNTPVQSSCVAVSGINILVFGGATNDMYPAISTASVQCFNTGLYTTTTIFDLPRPERFLRSICLGDKILVLSQNGSLGRVRGESAVEFVGKLENYRHTFATGVVKYSSGFLILGGICENGIRDDIIYYDCEDNESTQWGYMPYSLCRFGCGKVTVKTEHLSKPC